MYEINRLLPVLPIDIYIYGIARHHVTSGVGRCRKEMKVLPLNRASAKRITSIRNYIYVNYTTRDKTTPDFTGRHVVSGVTRGRNSEMVELVAVELSDPRRPYK
jgi:hypothetical protein